MSAVWSQHVKTAAFGESLTGGSGSLSPKAACYVSILSSFLRAAAANIDWNAEIFWSLDGERTIMSNSEFSSSFKTSLFILQTCQILRGEFARVFLPWKWFLSFLAKPFWEVNNNWRYFCDWNAPPVEVGMSKHSHFTTAIQSSKMLKGAKSFTALKSNQQQKVSYKTDVCSMAKFWNIVWKHYWTAPVVPFVHLQVCFLQNRKWVQNTQLLFD